MHSAPPVLVPVGRFVWGWRLVILLAACSAIVLLGVWRTSPEQGVVWLGLWAVSCLAAAVLVKRDSLPPGNLRWDGSDWFFAPNEGATIAVSVMALWDAGSGMLVAVHAPDGHWRGGRCTWVNERQLPAHWHAWRCAIHARKIL
jgi:hypothetical protein